MRVAGRAGVAGLAVAFLLTLAGAAGAASGDVDPTFGDRGHVLLPIGGDGGLATASVVQPDGKIVLAGYTTLGNPDFLVVRLTPEGVLDSTFGAGGIVRTPIDLRSVGRDEAHAIALGPGGTILLGGRAATASDPVLAFVRYTSSGALDPSFGDGGIQTLDLPGGADYARDVGIDSGRIVAAGWSWVAPWPAWTVVRLLSNGQLDGTFGSGGVVRTALGRSGDGDQAEAVELLTDGGILVSGTADWSVQPDFALVRYRPDGQLDPAFGTNGIVITYGVRPDSMADLKALPDGRLLAVGNSSGNDPYDSEFRLARYHPGGALDTTFGAGGIVVTNFPGTHLSIAESIAVQEDGKLVVGGRVEYDSDDRFALARYLESGALDESFGSAGLRSYDISCDEDPGYAVVVQRIAAQGGYRERIVQGGASYCYGDYFFAVLGVHATGPEPPPPSPPPSGYAITTETAQWMVRGTTDIGNHGGPPPFRWTRNGYAASLLS